MVDRINLLFNLNYKDYIIAISGSRLVHIPILHHGYSQIYHQLVSLKPLLDVSCRRNSCKGGHISGLDFWCNSHCTQDITIPMPHNYAHLLLIIYNTHHTCPTDSHNMASTSDTPICMATCQHTMYWSIPTYSIACFSNSLQDTGQNCFRILLSTLPPSFNVPSVPSNNTAWSPVVWSFQSH